MEQEKNESNQPLLELMNELNKCVEDFWKGVYVKNENQN